MVAAASSAKRRSVSAGTPGVPGGYLSSVSPQPPPPPTHVGASSPPLSEGEVEGQSGGSTGYQFHEVERPYQYQTHLQHQPPPPCPTPHASRFLNYLANIVHNICLVIFSYRFTNDLILPRRAEFREQFASYVTSVEKLYRLGTSLNLVLDRQPALSEPPILRRFLRDPPVHRQVSKSRLPPHVRFSADFDSRKPECLHVSLNFVLNFPLREYLPL